MPSCILPAIAADAGQLRPIGQLTGGIAHDFNNMLTIIMGNLDTLQRRLKSIDKSSILNRPIESAFKGHAMLRN